MNQRVAGRYSPSRNATHELESKARMERHRHNLEAAQSTLELPGRNAPPTSPTRSNAKRVAQQNERLDDIERKNQFLIKRMLSIFCRESNQTRNTQLHAGTLNYPTRQREMQRIERDNLKIMERLAGAESYYKRKDLLKDSGKYFQAPHLGIFPRAIGKGLSPRRKAATAPSRGSGGNTGASASVLVASSATASAGAAERSKRQLTRKSMETAAERSMHHLSMESGANKSPFHGAEEWSQPHSGQAASGSIISSGGPIRPSLGSGSVSHNASSRKGRRNMVQVGDIVFREGVCITPDYVMLTVTREEGGFGLRAYSPLTCREYTLMATLEELKPLLGNSSHLLDRLAEPASRLFWHQLSQSMQLVMASPESSEFSLMLYMSSSNYALRIQSCYRGARARSRRARELKACVKIQAVGRGYSLRCYHARVKSATKLQRRYRSFRTKRRNQKESAATAIQRETRKMLSKKARSEAARRIQAIHRGRASRLMSLKLKEAKVLISPKGDGEVAIESIEEDGSKEQEARANGRDGRGPPSSPPRSSHRKGLLQAKKGQGQEVRLANSPYLEKLPRPSEQGAGQKPNATGKRGGVQKHQRGRRGQRWVKSPSRQQQKDSIQPLHQGSSVEEDSCKAAVGGRRRYSQHGPGPGGLGAGPAGSVISSSLAASSTSVSVSLGGQTLYSRGMDSADGVMLSEDEGEGVPTLNIMLVFEDASGKVLRYLCSLKHEQEKQRVLVMANEPAAQQTTELHATGAVLAKAEAAAEKDKGPEGLLRAVAGCLHLEGGVISF
ncbi:unnamed protein product [Chrysoparadoxa australica]